MSTLTLGFLLLSLTLVSVLGYWVFITRSKARLFDTMSAYVNSIQVSVYYKLWPLLEVRYDRETAKRLAAAVTNKMFARPSTIHTEDEQRTAETLAAGLLKEDNEVRYAALMSLRTMIVRESAYKNSTAVAGIMQTVQWMREQWDLPPDHPNPVIMRELATNLRQKYSPQTDGT